jgi:peptide-methionine (S)-S-oxide reductase
MVALVMLVTRAATAFSLASALATRGGASRAASASMLGGLFGLMAEPKMATPENALKGRSQKMQVAPKHYVLGTPMEGPWPEGYKVAVLANGCFWGSEKGMWLLPGEGIYSTSVGYAAGFTPNPTYEEACSGRTGHTEAMQIVYDPKKISFVDILRWFWEAHDPTAGMSQGNDVGTQYRSGAYWFDDEQKELILASKAAYEKALGRKITTECAAASDYDKYGGLYYYAENYHRASAMAFGRVAARSIQRVAARPACQRCARLLPPGLSPLFIPHRPTPHRPAPHRPTPHCRTPPPCFVAEQYLAKPGARPYCSAQPQRVSMPPFAEWAPAGLLEKHAPKLPEAFWKKYGLSGNSKACGVVGRPNEPVKMGDW